MFTFTGCPLAVRVDAVTSKTRFKGQVFFLAKKIAVKIAPEPTYGLLARRSNTRARPTMHEDPPDLDERGLQLKDLLDSFGVSSREGLPKLRAWLDAGEDPNAVLALHGPTTKRSILSAALEHGRVDSTPFSQFSEVYRRS